MEIFNVAFELGFSIVQFFYPGKIKYIIVGCWDDNIPLSDHVMYDLKTNIIKLLLHDREKSEVIRDSYIPLDYNQLTTGNEIHECDKSIRDSTTIHIPRKAKDIIERNKTFYPNNIDPIKKREKNTIILTSNQFNNLYSNVTFPEHSKNSFIDPIIFFRGIQNVKTLIQNVSEEIIKKYDYMIIHLLSDKYDGVDFSRKHNFQSGIIAGMMRALKKGYDPDYYIAHKKNIRPNLRCSDITIYDRYENVHEIEDIVNEMITHKINI